MSYVTCLMSHVFNLGEFRSVICVVGLLDRNLDVFEHESTMAQII